MPRSAGCLLLGLMLLAVTAATAAPTAFETPARVWHANLGAERQLSLVGDFSGDGKADVAVFTRDALPAPRQGNVFVAPSSGSAFVGPALWHANMCVTGTPVVGDFTGDGKDDVAIVTNGDTVIRVAVSDGERFADPAPWHTGFDPHQMTALAGDMNGDRRDDLVLFVKDTMAGGERADVDVLLSEGSGFRQQVEKWSDFFGVGLETPLLGDFDGDGRCDAATWVDPGSGAWNPGYLYVALSKPAPGGLDNSKTWSTAAGNGAQVATATDVNGDGKCDAVLFCRGTRGSAALGDVRVLLSTGRNFAPPALWHDFFCVQGETPLVGDLTGDRCGDIATCIGDTQGEPGRGDVMVAAAIEPHDVAGWRFALGMVHCLRKNEAGDEWVYFVPLQFRVTPGVRGSARVTWSGNITPSNVQIARPNRFTVPAELGELRFPNVRMLTPAESTTGRQPELLGAAIILLERDDTDEVRRERDLQAARQAFLAQLAQRVEALNRPAVAVALAAVGEAYRVAIADPGIISDELLVNDDDVIGHWLFVNAALQPPQPGASVSGGWAGSALQESSGTARFGAPNADDGCYDADWTFRRQ